jgi:hypothetical protein
MQEGQISLLSTHDSQNGFEKKILDMTVIAERLIKLETEIFFKLFAFLKL